MRYLLFCNGKIEEDFDAEEAEAKTKFLFWKNENEIDPLYDEIVLVQVIEVDSYVRTTGNM